MGLLSWLGWEPKDEDNEREKDREEFDEDCCGECCMPKHACQCPPSGTGPCGGGSRGWGVGK